MSGIREYYLGHMWNSNEPRMAIQVNNNILSLQSLSEIRLPSIAWLEIVSAVLKAAVTEKYNSAHISHFDTSLSGILYNYETGEAVITERSESEKVPFDLCAEDVSWQAPNVSQNSAQNSRIILMQVVKTLTALLGIKPGFSKFMPEFTLAKDKFPDVLVREQIAKMLSGLLAAEKVEMASHEFAMLSLNAIRKINEIIGGLHHQDKTLHVGLIDLNNFHGVDSRYAKTKLAASLAVMDEVWLIDAKLQHPFFARNVKHWLERSGVYVSTRLFYGEDINEILRGIHRHIDRCHPSSRLYSYYHLTLEKMHLIHAADVCDSPVFEVGRKLCEERDRILLKYGDDKLAQDRIRQIDELLSKIQQKGQSMPLERLKDKLKDLHHQARQGLFGSGLTSRWKNLKKIRQQLVQAEAKKRKSAF